MNSSVVTAAFVAWAILLCAVFAAIELLWLRGVAQFLTSRGALLFLTVVNAVFLTFAFGLLNLFGGGAFILLVFPVPVLPILYGICKLWAYARLPAYYALEPALASLRHPWLLLFCALPIHGTIGYFAWQGFSDFNPSKENLETAIRAKSTTRLEAMLWLSVTFEPEMTSLVNEAITCQNFDAVQRLVRHGADPTQTYWLREASRPIQSFLVKWMLARGVKIEDLNLSRGPGFEAIAVGGTVEDLEYCLRQGFQPGKFPQVIHAAIEEQPIGEGIDASAVMLAKIRLLLANGADLRATDLLMFPPLLTAVRMPENLTPVIAFLIEQGADINARSINPLYPTGRAAIPAGITPLMLAVILKRPAVAELFLAKGADKTLRDSAGKTALDYAVETGASAELQRKLAVAE